MRSLAPLSARRSAPSPSGFNSMAFTDNQIALLEAKLPERHVKTRIQDGRVLAYLEGWRIIEEANRIFGFDGWDRVTLKTERLHEAQAAGRYACAFSAQVRVIVRAGGVPVVREGAGVGHGRAADPFDAYDIALKAAETDATKRAFATFGNRFGLALYDPDRRGVRRTPGPRPGTASWEVKDETGMITARYGAPSQAASALRAQLQAADPGALTKLWTANAGLIARLRRAAPQLKTREGDHYADALERLYAKRKPATMRPPAPEKPPRPRIDKSALAVSAPKRRRDADHLKYVAREPCLICGRKPCEAHHVTYAQPRAMARKVSDEFAVPLCALHHRKLHMAGDERAWWAEHKIDPLQVAKGLWEISRASLKLRIVIDDELEDEAPPKPNGSG